jgi:hypothetical protein
MVDNDCSQDGAKSPQNETDSGGDLRPPLPVRGSAASRARPKAKDEGAVGALLPVIYGSQAMKAYPVTEVQLTSVSLINSIAGVAFTLFGFFIGLTLEIYISSSFYQTLPPEAAVLVKFGGSVTAALAFVCLIFGIVSVCIRSSTWHKIKSNTRFPDSGAQ